MNAQRPSVRATLVAVGALAACSSSAPPAPQPLAYTQPLLNQLASSPPPEDEASPAPVAIASPSPPPPPRDHEPRLVRRDVPETVTAGRSVTFGLDVIDEDMDVVRVELGAHPEGATLDPHTLTVHWNVPANATGAQQFVAHIVEDPGDANERAFDRPIAIQVGAMPAAATASTPAPSPYVGTLVTITDPHFLARAAREWPIERLLETLRDDVIDALPATEQHAVQRRVGAELFRDLLTAYAAAHQYAAMDPANHAFDRRFESAHWHLVAVRPRVNKAIEEIRLVYQDVDVAEPVFAMFRVRLFRGASAPPELALANNLAFTRLVHDAFFDGARAKPGIAEGQARAVSTAVATLVRSVLTFRDAHDPRLRTGVAAIPEEARLGGGSRFDAEGTYLSGNAWAYSVANLVIDPASATPRAIRVATVPLSSFTFDIGENDAHDAFVSVCPPRYREGGAGNEPGLAALCQPDGTVRIPERNADGHWVPTRRDSLDEHHDVTAVEMVSRVALRDPRRRNFEESGMTCVQCHTRNFDDGVLSEVQVRDPRVHEPITPAHDVDPVAVQVLPIGVVPRSPWFVQQETFQVCDLGRKLHDQLHVTVDLPCPEGY